MVRIEVLEIVHATCERCGHQWKTHGSLPAVCAKCKSRLWHRSLLVERSSRLVPFKEPLVAMEMPEHHLGPKIHNLDVRK